MERFIGENVCRKTHPWEALGDWTAGMGAQCGGGAGMGVQCGGGAGMGVQCGGGAGMGVQCEGGAGRVHSVGVVLGGINMVCKGKL